MRKIFIILFLIPFYISAQYLSVNGKYVAYNGKYVKNVSAIPDTLIGKDGYLYNWWVVETGILAPVGLHVPTDAEWTTLTTYLGGLAVAGGKLKEIGLIHWNSPNTGATNEVNFTAIGTGNRYYGGPFTSAKIESFWWSTTQSSSSNAYYIKMKYSDKTVVRGQLSKKLGNSIRCMRDATVAEQLLVDGTFLSSMTDIDGNIYNMVKIGTQVWMDNDLRTTKYNDGSPISNVTDNAAWSALTTGAYCSYNNSPLN